MAGAYLVEPEKKEDERGYFVRTFCVEQFRERGLNTSVAQCSVSFNKRKGTLRGMHFQAAPHEEAKLVSCVSGSVYDVIVDIRRDSPTFMSWRGYELSAANGLAIFVPEGFAHGFQALAGNSRVYYQISEFYKPEFSRGFRWDDPEIGIKWPESDARVISDRDENLPLFANINTQFSNDS